MIGEMKTKNTIAGFVKDEDRFGNGYAHQPRDLSHSILFIYKQATFCSKLGKKVGCDQSIKVRKSRLATRRTLYPVQSTDIMAAFIIALLRK